MSRLATVVAVLAAIVLQGCASSPGTTLDNSPGRDRGSPMYAVTLQRQGSVLLQQRRYKEALQQFQEAQRLQPGNPSVYNMIGLCHMRIGDLEQALASFDSALLRAPAFTDARNNRGAVYLALGQHQLAEVDFMAVLGDSTYPHRTEVYFNLGMTFLRRNQLGPAEENLRRAVVASTPVFEAFRQLSEIERRRGNLDGSLSWLEEAALKFPDRPEASLELGRVLIELGRPEEARKPLDQIINQDPRSPAADQARALLEQI